MFTDPSTHMITLQDEFSSENLIICCSVLLLSKQKLYRLIAVNDKNIHYYTFQAFFRRWCQQPSTGSRPPLPILQQSLTNPWKTPGLRQQMPGRSITLFIFVIYSNQRFRFVKKPKNNKDTLRSSQPPTSRNVSLMSWPLINDAIELIASMIASASHILVRL